MTDKKGKQVTFTDQLPSQATANPRNQGASSTETHNINHVHVDEEAVESVIPLNSSEFLKIGKFGIIFDAIPRGINDLAVSSHHHPLV